MKTCGCCGWSESAHGAVLSSIPKNPPCGQFQPLQAAETASSACVACGHDISHHDQPDCWECSNAGTVCELLEDLRTVANAGSGATGAPLANDERARPICDHANDVCHHWDGPSHGFRHAQPCTPTATRPIPNDADGPSW